MNRRVVAVVPDLFFAAKITATAEATGVPLETPSLGAATARCRELRPALVILDLGEGEAALEIARELKADPATARIPIVGFYSHVEGMTRNAALAAGIDHVLPRSAFVTRLAALLQDASAISP